MLNTNRYKTALKACVKAAHRSNHRQHHMGAALMKGGALIAVGWNTDHIHTEHAALNRAWRSGTEGCTLFVVRIRKDGSWGMAKPCQLCTERLIVAGIKKVVYSNITGELTALKLPSPKSSHSTPYLQYHFFK